MSITAKKPEGSFTRILAPAGLQAAVCVDVIDQGWQEQEWKGVSKNVHKVSIHWLLGKLIPTGVWQHPHTGKDVEVSEELAGKPFMVSKWYTNSLHEKATLRNHLETWRGKTFSDQELEGFDLEKLIGVPAGLSVVHAESKGEWYANVEGVSSLPDEWPTPPVGDYVRRKDREGYDEHGRRIQEGQTYEDRRTTDGPPPMWEGGPVDDGLPF